MSIMHTSMCNNIRRCSQYIVMHNTGVTDLEISKQIDIMKVHHIGNISAEYSYLCTIYIELIVIQICSIKYLC